MEFLWKSGIVLLLVIWQSAFAEQAKLQSPIYVKGLFEGGAVLVIEGQQHVLREGKTVAAVTLIDANSRRAIVDVNGERQTLKLSTEIGTTFSEPQKAVKQIRGNAAGHFYTAGQVNNRQVTFMVDTGASTVTMNSSDATGLGIDFKSGAPVNVSTASGVVRGYRVRLNRVVVGTISVPNVDAVVIEGSYPTDILLGNSYLSRVDMRVENNILVLQAKF